MPSAERSTDGCRELGYARELSLTDGEALQQLVFHGIASRSSARGDPNLLQIERTCELTVIRPLGDLRAGQALSEQTQYIHLALRPTENQSGRPVPVGETGGPLEYEYSTPGRD